MGSRDDERPDAETVEQLRTQLAAATAAACDAYQDNARLVRVLTVIGQPSSPTQLADQALTTLSQVFNADVTAIARLMTGRLVVTSACGLPEGDPAYTTGWSANPAAAEALRGAGATACDADDLHRGGGIPPSLAGLGIRSAAWIPLRGDTEPGDELLILYRRSSECFTPAELQVLRSVAFRLRLAVEARERSVLAERLATCGHRLTRHLDLPTLLDEAAGLLRDLLLADRTCVVTVHKGQATLRACRGEGTFPTTPIPVRRLPSWQTVAAGRAYRDANCTGCSFGPPDVYAVLCVPVTRDETPIALLLAFRETPRPFLDDEVETATVFANYLNSSMINCELYHALGESEASLRLITDSISDLIAVVDGAGRFVYASPSYERELARPPESLSGLGIADLTHPDDAGRLRTALGNARCSPKVEYRLRTGSGSWIWVESALRPAPAAGGEIVLSSRVVEERRRLEDELRQRATHDPLTGLANRVLTRQRLDEALGRDAADRVGLLYCDLDRFKAVNDRLGHEAGDELLQLVADRLRRCLRRDDLLARLGGDEFVFILDGIDGLDDIARVSRRVAAALDPPFELRGERVRVSASMGGVCGTRGHDTATAMLRDADAAMYTAKGKGQGLLEVFDDDASHRSLDRLDIRSDLCQALDRCELTTHYQPIFDLPSGAIIAFEALLRWHHPTRGQIPPDLFIPLAEETGAILPIGGWVLEQACLQLATWQRLPRCPRLAININLSANQLRQSDLVATALTTIDKASVSPADVWLEVTEHSAAGVDATEHAVALHRAGVHFCLDDFGISYSNLSHLRRFPVECLKIDKSFVAGLEMDAGDAGFDRGIVRAVLAIADSLGLGVVAEGIETRRQREALLELGCPRGQGYLLSRPVPPAEATTLLLDNAAAARQPEPRRRVSSRRDPGAARRTGATRPQPAPGPGPTAGSAGR